MLISSKVSELLSASVSSSKETFCSGLYLSARWFVFSQVAKGLNVIVLPNRDSAEYCSSDLYNLTEGDSVFFLPTSGKNIEKSNFKSTLGVQRTSAIEKILSYEEGPLTIVTFPEALSETVPLASEMLSMKFSLSVGEEIPHDEIREKLAEIGFEKVDFVALPGQYAVRGSIIDIFSFSYNNPFRISFFGNEIEKISLFDCNTQLSKEKVDKADICGDMVSDEGKSETPVTSIFPKDTTVWLDSSDMYRECGFFPSLLSFRHVFMEVPISMKGKDVDAVTFNISPQPVFNKNFELLKSDLSSKMESGYEVYIFGEKQSQLDRLKNILTSENFGKLPAFVAKKNIHNGFIDKDDKICCYSDHEIFDRFHRVVLRRSVEKTEQLTINDLSAFNVGDYIVHIDHGVGIFGGLVRYRINENDTKLREAVKLIYKDGDTVMVSVHNLHKISRFKSKDSVPPAIHRLGSKSWQLLKNRAKSRVKDIAKELIQLYAKRKASKGFAFSPDTYLQEELESSFMFEDTPDQNTATQAVKRDMEEGSPMDRLICGDVGFGKTEIAIRASFKAVSDNKQVAVLVPTTILSLQHYNTFSSRLKDFPCTVEYVSRLRSAKDISRIKKDLASGKIDILIGTHKILSDEFEFKDLGLLVIDEEQKFGVGAKEKLRQMKMNVDTLTLTATPIPRTLQFSLLGARDLSIINTPPPNRIPIQTEIMLFEKNEITSIINYELKRGGQIFFLHNRVEELDAIYNILHGLVPHMKICIAHGQMPARELEEKMLNFMQGDYDMLLCTTIIENGLDIPNANTIIINQAQNFGLSDLHQLRGRVGRSNVKAFCYLIVPPMTTLTQEATRRLRAIEEFSDLGSGFNIAMQDLDIRGAGNLLGAEQSGFIENMGYETYQKILSEAMEELGMETGIITNSSNKGSIIDCSVDTDFPAVIPDEYIDVSSEKIRIYKELDSLRSEEELEKFSGVLSDRFGNMPEEVSNLFDIVRIRILGQDRGFDRIIVKGGILICYFASEDKMKYIGQDVIGRIISNISTLGDKGKLAQSKEGRLKFVGYGINSLSQAATMLKKL